MPYNYFPDLRPAPKEIDGPWPWRKGSKLRYAFQKVYDGISKQSFEALFRKGGPLFASGVHGEGRTDAESQRNAQISLKHTLKCLRSGRAGKNVKTHSWDFKDDGIGYVVYNVKYRPKKQEKTKIRH